MLDRTRDHLADLVAFPTVSSDSNLAMIAYLADALETYGARCQILHDDSGQKANLFATMGPDAPGGVLLSGHTDVVPVTDQPWTHDPFAVSEVDGQLFGRGTCDMKGFVAASLALAHAVSTTALSTPLHFAFTYDEEVGCLGAQALVDRLARQGIVPDMAIVGEPTEMRLVDGHKGCFEYTTRFSGLEGHGSDPDAGVNAVEYAARYAARLLDLRADLKQRAPADSAFEPPWSTLSIGRLTGGTARNVIASRAELEWEMRPVQPEDAEYVKSALTKFVAQDLLPQMRKVHPDASVTVETIAEVIGLVAKEDNPARDLVADLTGANRSEFVAFGTEAGLFQSLGTHVVICGPGSIAQAHKADEFVSLDQLAQCCRMLDRLQARLTA